MFETFSFSLVLS